MELPPVEEESGPVVDSAGLEVVSPVSELIVVEGTSSELLLVSLAVVVFTELPLDALEVPVDVVGGLEGPEVELLLVEADKKVFAIP